MFIWCYLLLNDLYYICLIELDKTCDGNVLCSTIVIGWIWNVWGQQAKTMHGVNDCHKRDLIWLVS